jgi:hypothetical protein
LGKLHEIARLYVNFFQPSFKLKSKTRLGAKVSKKYEKPATPYERLLADDRVTSQCKDTLRQIFAVLDPVRLLSEIREAQRNLTQLEVGGGAVTTPEAAQDLNRFVKGLSTAWREGEVRPTHPKTADGPRAWRTRVDPFEDTWSLVEEWLSQQPDATAKELFHRLQEQARNQFAAGQLRTLQRRVKQWRTEIARQLVVGSGTDNAEQRNTRTKEKEEIIS